ncbi:MAG: TolC family protein [Candidatus Krumholzibacteria bacterium]|jgi:outer membrane protein TolC|nr:TolC family protein [Candidatus Krumholzibacteria bacterium]MDP6670098.1 TolC family protein [Candidatus Krumholzibacteria bacterium]MDP6796754.1 TolC family protein [Candidatus Krumholzibacteria bacterium]MDP7021692.1 TolC family protein [Candidatus Krumholzibacteria bacterium]
MSQSNARFFKAVVLGFVLVLPVASALALELDLGGDMLQSKPQMPSFQGVMQGGMGDHWKSAKTEVYPDNRQSLSLGLRDAISLGLRNNPTLRSIWYAGEAEATDVEASNARFSWQLSGKAEANPGNNRLIYAREAVALNLAKRFPTGTLLYARHAIEHGPDQVFNYGSSAYYEDLSRQRMTLRVVQPVQRNLGTANNLAPGRIELEEFSSTVSTYRHTADYLAYEIEEAYWRLYGYQETLKASHASLESARQLFELTSLRFKSGEISQMELLVSEAGVAARREDIILGKIRVEQARDKLLGLLLDENSPSRLSSIVELKDEPILKVDIPPYLPPLEEVLSSRQDYLRVRHDIAANEFNIVKAKNNMKPGLYVTGEISYTSIGGTLNYSGDPYSEDPIVPPSAYEGGVELFVGVEADLHFPNSAQRADYYRANHKLMESREHLRAVEMRIITEMREAKLVLESCHERIQVTRASRDLAEKQLAGERKRLDLGQTSNHAVLLFEDQLTQSRTREIEAVVDLQIAMAQLRKASGSGLEHFGLSF